MEKNNNLNSTNANREKCKGTFIVKVEFCQHNSWQGKVIWAEENKEVRFRSALELVNLMNEAMNQVQMANEKNNNEEHSVS